MYFSVAFFIFLLILLSPFKKNNSYLDLVSLLLLTGIAAFSSNNGWDSYNYKEIYGLIVDGGVASVLEYSTKGLEFGYLTFLYFVSFLSDNFQVVVFVQAIIVNLIFFKAIRSLNFNYLIFSVLFFSSFYLKFELSTLRQGFAVALVALSFIALTRRSFLGYCSLIVCAALMHYSAIVLLPLFFFWGISISKKKVLILAFFAIPFFYISVYLKSYVYEFLLSAGLGAIPVLGKVVAYLSKSDNTNLPVVQIYSLLLYVFYGLFFYNPLLPRHKLTIYLFTFLILIQFYLKMFPSLIMVRFEYYFILSQTFATILILESIRLRSGFRYFSVFLFFVIIINYIIVFRNGAERSVYIPYKSVMAEVLLNQPVRTHDEIKSAVSEYISK